MSEEDRYVNLAVAIVARAVEELREALLFNDKAQEKRCVRFFESGGPMFLANVSGTFILEKIRDEVNALKRGGMT